MQSAGRRRGKKAAPSNMSPPPLPRRKIRCTQEQRDEWVNCSTPQNEAAARTIQREISRDRTRERRRRQDPVVHSRYEVPDLRRRYEPVTSKTGPYALPQLAKRVAEMDAIREARGNPFPYPPSHPRHIPQAYPAPLFRQPVDDHISRVDDGFLEPRSSRPSRSSPPPSPKQTARRQSRTTKPKKSPVTKPRQNPRIVLRLPRRRKTPSPSIDVPENPHGHFGTIAGRDEVGEFFDYSNLVPNRGGRQDDDSEESDEKNIDDDDGAYVDEDALSQHSQDSDGEDGLGPGSHDTDEQDYETNSDDGDRIPYNSGSKQQDYEDNSEHGELSYHGQVTREQYPYHEMNELSAGAAARVRQLEEEQEDNDVSVDHSIPDTWLSADARTRQQETPRANSSIGANPFAAFGTDRSCAPAFALRARRHNPYQRHGQERTFNFATAVQTAPQSATWNTMPPPPPRTASSSRTVTGESTTRFASNHQSDYSGLDVNAARNQALEGAFNSDSVTRVTETRHENIPARMHETTSDGASQKSPDYQPETDDRLEDVRLNIDPNVRANFIPLSQLHSVLRKRSVFEMQNPNLIATNQNAQISTVGGETLTYTPSPMDERMDSLDRHGNYIGEDQGNISKRHKRHHAEMISARDREMIEANRAYQSLLVMTPQSRTELLERLRKPFIFYGAFGADQEVMDEIPEIYTQDLSSRVMNWMDCSPSDAEHTPDVSGGPASSAVSSANDERADHFRTFDDFGDLDDFATGSPFIPLENSVQRQVKRTEQYFEDVVFFGGESSKVQLSQNEKSVEAPPLSQPSDINSRTLFSQSAQSSDIGSPAPPSLYSSSTQGAQYHASYTTQSELGHLTIASSRGIDDPFNFDDSPEFQIPQDVEIECTVDLTARQERLYRLAKGHSEKYGRVVLIRLHEPVKFTPGAVAQRVFCGVVQEMQLFPAQRLAIVVFLHCAEAKAFLQHVKRTHEIGDAHEIRSLQIEAGWYKGSEKDAILPAQSKILRHHITMEATRTLRLTRIGLTKTVSQVSAELGSRLSKMLLKVILTAAKQKYLQEEQGRQAVVEFASVRDAIEAKDKLDAGTITAYGICEGNGGVAYAGDPCGRVAAEKAWCKCMGCKEQRAEKV